MGVERGLEGEESAWNDFYLHAGEAKRLTSTVEIPGKVKGVSIFCV